MNSIFSGGSSTLFIIGGVVVFVLFVIPFIVSSFLRDVEAGTIRLVSWLAGGTVIYRGPGKSKEIPLLTTGTTISSKVINIDLDITDQTADVDAHGTPAPIKVRVLASAIVSVGDSDALIKTAANRFFSKSDADQLNTLTDLLSSSGRRAMNLLTHDQLFSAKSAPAVRAMLPGATSGATLPVKSATTAVVPAEPALEDEDDPLAVIIRKACSRELTDLGLIFNSLNIKVVQSEVAEARRRQSAAEAQANADIVSATQSRRAKEAQLEAERAISDKQRELEQTRAANAALIAQAEAKRQEAAGVQRVAELDATQIAQARADAAKVRLEAEAAADAEAIRIRKIAEATAESIQKVNQAIQAGGESYFRYRQIEMLPQIAPVIADALSEAKLVTIANGDTGAPETTTNNITSVIQTVLAAQLVSRGLIDNSSNNGTVPSAVEARLLSSISAPPAAKK
jgi:flotillin